MSMTNVSVIIPWKDRPELKVTLAINARVFAQYDAEVIVANCGGDRVMVETFAEQADVPGLRHLFVPHASFNRSLAKNLGVHCSTGRILFFLDADIMLTTDVFASALPLMESGDGFVQIRRVNESQPRVDPYMSFVAEKSEIQEFVLHDGRRAVIHCLKGSGGSRCGPGLMFLTREQVLAVNGFNSALHGWGFEDLDFQIRLQIATGATLRMTGEVTHLTHADDLRGANECQNNMIKCADQYRRANFAGTFDEDVRAWRDQVVEMPLGRAVAS
jgi:glycosyltransferase involved in cell wall biosynthesis